MRWCASAVTAVDVDGYGATAASTPRGLVGGARGMDEGATMCATVDPGGLGGRCRHGSFKLARRCCYHGKRGTAA